MKGGEYAMVEFFVEMVFIVLLFLFVYNIVLTLANPDMQIAFLNSELLASKMGEACTNDKATLDGFQLSQPKPSNTVTSVLNMASSGAATEFFSKIMLARSSDPHFLLYYEAFPFGESVGWDVYQNNRNILFAPFEVDGTEIKSSVFEDRLWRNSDYNFLNRTYTSAKEKISNVGEEFKEDNAESVGADIMVYTTNIMLDDRLNAIPTEEPEQLSKTFKREETGNLGKWQNDDFYKFFGYASLKTEEQMAVKYRPCGVNSLCLKTREGVHRFKLDDACKNIKYVELVYDSTHATMSIVNALEGGGSLIAGTTVTIALLLRWQPRAASLMAALTTYAGAKYGKEMFSNILGYKNSDFYSASPCNIKSKIEIKKISCADIKCSKLMKYPIYKYSNDGQNVNKVGEHYTCMQNIGENFDYDKLDSQNIDGDCMQIKVSEVYNDFCWTPDPYSPALWSSLKDTFKTLTGNIVHSFPVKKNTEFMLLDGVSAVMLKPVPESFSKAGFWKTTFDLDWRWPMGYLAPG
ncbi:MAG: hypothetical protein V1802_02400 [Candidatus Aenigmatarchaeota archaeon]